MSARLFWPLVFVCAAFVLFKNLGSPTLWQDEAWTAVLARNTLTTGLPTVDDGRNFVSTNMGMDHDAHGIWNYSPWLDIYMAAGAFAVLGQSTFTARLPFALFGLLTFPLLFRVAQLWSKDKRTPYLTVVLTLMSVPYLLHARQCRYYVVAAFFAFYLYYAYHEMLTSRKGQPWHIVASSFGLFQSNFLVFFAVLGGIVAHFLLFIEDKKPILRRAAAPLSISLALLLPWCFYFHIFGRAAGDSGHALSLRWDNLSAYLPAIDSYLFPLLLVPAVTLDPKRFRRLSAPICFLVGGLSFLILAPHHFFRYMIAFIPIFSFLIAEIFWMLFDRKPAAAALLMAALLVTNVCSVSFWMGRSRFLKTAGIDFLHEIMHPINEPVRAAADYLNQHAGPNDLLLVSYPDLPFIFYTSLRVVGGGSGPRRIQPKEVRWVLLRDDSEKSAWPVDLGHFAKIPLGAPNWPWGSRPDPDLHVYRTATTPEPAAIYRRL